VGTTTVVTTTTGEPFALVVVDIESLWVCVGLDEAIVADLLFGGDKFPAAFGTFDVYAR
jgi:hypothetical protein